MEPRELTLFNDSLIKAAESLRAAIIHLSNIPGHLDSGSDPHQLDNYFDSQTLQTRICVMEEQLAVVLREQCIDFDPCEGCGKQAQRHDCDGVPLCEACWHELVHEEDH